MIKEQTNNGFRANPNLINKELAMRSHSGTSWDPEKRGEQEIAEFVSYVQEFYERLKKAAKTDQQKQYLLTEMERFQSSFASKYNAKLSAQGSCLSTMIAGPSNFPVRRAQKACSAADKRYEELIEFRDRAEAAILRELRKMGVEEAGGELEVLKKKIADAERNHEFMVKTNAIVRKKIPDDQKIREIMALAPISEKTAREILKPDFMQRVGFPAYALSNDTANIHRMKDRLKELEKKEVTPTGELSFTGGSIVDNREADRVQIFFDQRPSQEMINKLKGEGWRWSPSNSAWQRKRTDAAMMSARRITGSAAVQLPTPAVQAISGNNINSLAKLRASEWFKAQISNPYERYYLYHRVGDFRVSNTEPQGYTLSYPERISPAWTVEQATQWIINAAQRLPILPLDIVPAPASIVQALAAVPRPPPYALPELKWVYGTKDLKWHLVCPEDRDYAHGITQARMRQIGQEAARAEYLGPSLARTAAPVRPALMYVPPKYPPMLYPAPEHLEVRKYTTPRTFKKGTIARNKITNEKFVLETDVEALQQDKNAMIWKTNDAHGYLIYLDDQRPAPIPITQKPYKITDEDIRLLKGYENYTNEAIQKKILQNEGKLKVLAARKLVRIEKGKYGTMGSAYIEQERLGISQENSTLMRVLELRELIATRVMEEPDIVGRVRTAVAPVKQPYPAPQAPAVSVKVPWPTEKPAPIKFVQKTFQVEERMRRFGYA